MSLGDMLFPSITQPTDATEKLRRLRFTYCKYLREIRSGSIFANAANQIFISPCLYDESMFSELVYTNISNYRTILETHKYIYRNSATNLQQETACLGIVENIDLEIQSQNYNFYLESVEKITPEAKPFYLSGFDWIKKWRTVIIPIVVMVVYVLWAFRSKYKNDLLTPAIVVPTLILLIIELFIKIKK